MLNGTTHYKLPFSIATLNYQSVYYYILLESSIDGISGSMSVFFFGQGGDHSICFPRNPFKQLEDFNVHRDSNLGGIARLKQGIASGND